MDTENRTIPPSQGRIAAAAKQGMFPRSNLWVWGLVLLAGAGMIQLLGAVIGHQVQALTADALQQAFQPSAPVSPLLSRTASVLLWGTLPLLAAVTGLAGLGTIWSALKSKRGHARTAVPLPNAPRESLSIEVVRGFTLVMAVLVSLHVLRHQATRLSDVISGTLSPFPFLQRATTAALAAAGAVFILGGLIELALQRHTMLKNLALSPSDWQKEQRAAGGNPIARSEHRRRLRNGATTE